MERLTRKIEKSSWRDRGRKPSGYTSDYTKQEVDGHLALYENLCFDKDGKEIIKLERLAALVQAESEGRVDIHPCTEGTAVYVIREVRNHYLEPYHYEIQVMAYKKYMLKNYGKTVFLEKDKASAALTAMEGQE